MAAHTPLLSFLSVHFSPNTLKSKRIEKNERAKGMCCVCVCVLEKGGREGKKEKCNKEQQAASATAAVSLKNAARISMWVTFREGRAALTCPSKLW